MRSSGVRTPCRSRSASTCRAMMSRKLSPSRTGSADFGPLIPMLVPSPPLSLMTTVWPSASATAASSGRTSSRCTTSVSGSMLSSGMVPVAADRSCAWKRLNTDTASSDTPAARILSVAARRPSVVMRQPYDAGMARDPEKSARRSTLRAHRRAIAATRDTAADGAALADHVVALLASLGLGPGSVVTSYVAVPGEPPTAALNAALAAHGIRVLVPITLADLDLDWADAFDATDAASAALGLEGVALADLVLAPGLAVDRTGHPDGPGRRLLRPGPAAPPPGHARGGRAAPRRAARRGRAAPAAAGPRPAGRRRRDRRRRDRPRAQPVESAPSGRRVSTSGSVSLTAASVNGHGR